MSSMRQHTRGSSAGRGGFARLFAIAGTALLASCGQGDREADESGQAPAAAAPEEKVLNVYNWSDYIAPDTIQNFEKEFGIKVNYDVFDSNEVLESKLSAGGSGYDVVVPTASFMERQIRSGIFRKLDRSKLANLKNMDPQIQKRVQLHDPDNEHSVNYMWGTTGVGYNRQKVEKALGRPVDSWAAVFEPASAARLESCGISFLDSASEMASMMLAYLGKDPNSQSEEDLKEVEAKFMAVRPHIRYIHSSQYINDLSNGEICAAVGYSGDVLQARDRAEEAKNGIEVAYAVPSEGTIIWFDMLAIPADAPHPDNAHTFINYLMRPEVIAAVSNEVNYANGNAASLPYIDDAVKNDPGVYPPPQVMNKLFPDLAETEEFTRLLTRMWTRVKTGQ